MQGNMQFNVNDNEPKKFLPRNYSYVSRTVQIVMKDTRHIDNTITCVIAGRYIQAKVYDEPSKYGINKGRVSKLSISKNMMLDRGRSIIEQTDYLYDREVLHNNLIDEDVDVVVEALEKLPKSE